MRKPVSRAVAILLPIVIACTGCQAITSDASVKPTVNLLTPALPDSLNPLAGFDNNGVGKINESLFTLEGESDTLPQIVPLLAQKDPKISADGLTWDITLRNGINFSDGTTLDPADVVASYQAIKDPRTASPLASTLENLASVKTHGKDGVRFTLHEPQVSFKTSLLVGIAPSELIHEGTPISESSLNRSPVGTGPYVLDHFDSSSLTLSANKNFRDGPPDVQKVSYTQSEDDNARTQAMASSDFTGTVLPPRLAASFAQREGYEVVTASSADWRGISLPADHPFTKDPKVRLALNLAINREEMISGVLAGAGRPAYTFVPPEYGQFYNSKAVFTRDPRRAEELLDDAGWVSNKDGIRTKNGVRAEFTLLYNPGDTLRRDLSLALASQLEKFGIKISVQPATFDQAEPRVSTDSIMLGGGDTPYDVDTQLYKMLHSSYPEAGAYYDNPSHFSNAKMDQALHQGRTSTDPHTRATAYKDVQDLYVKDPSMLLIAFSDHSYVQRSDVHNTWNTTGTLLEPHEHGTAWGPWAKIGAWSKK